MSSCVFSFLSAPHGFIQHILSVVLDMTFVVEEKCRLYILQDCYICIYTHTYRVLSTPSGMDIPCPYSGTVPNRAWRLIAIIV